MPSDSTLAFAGAWQDHLTGGYPLGNGYRTYLPGLMRFVCPDNLSPFGEGGPNPYAYCAADPINRIDPSGHFSFRSLTRLFSCFMGSTDADVAQSSSIAWRRTAAAASEVADASAPYGANAGGQEAFHRYMTPHVKISADENALFGYSAMTLTGYNSYGTETLLPEPLRLEPGGSITAELADARVRIDGAGHVPGNAPRAGAFGGVHLSFDLETVGNRPIRPNRMRMQLRYHVRNRPDLDFPDHDFHVLYWMAAPGDEASVPALQARPDVQPARMQPTHNNNTPVELGFTITGLTPPMDTNNITEVARLITQRRPVKP